MQDQTTQGQIMQGQIMIDLWIVEVTPFELGLLSFPALLLIIACRIPLAAAMFLLGLLGTWLLAGDLRMVDSQLRTFAFGTLTNYSLSIIPLFLLMSDFASRSGMSSALFAAAEAWLGHHRGGMAMAAIGASAGFGAICGSSTATASTMGKVALPELRRAGYSHALATGTLAAGGTLGILIPPSVVLVIYAILAEENIEKLFAAALVPGLIAMLGYMITIAIYVRLAPGSVVDLPRRDFRDRFRLLFAVWPVVVIFGLVIFGIYVGLFSPTAAAAVGVAGVALLAITRKVLTTQALMEALLSTAKTSAMIFFIILAAGFFNSFLSAAKVPQTLAEIFLSASVTPWLVLVGILLLYLVLGMVMDSLAMIFLTVPIFIPIVTQLDFGIPAAEVGIWFGILVLMSAEIGLITPPVGMNLFVINSMARGVPIAATYRGALPFVITDLIRVAILVVFPTLSLWLVRLLY